jgi:hypothetical protein
MQITEWQEYGDTLGDYGGRAYLLDSPSNAETQLFGELAEQFWLGLTPGINADVIEIPRTTDWPTACRSVEQLVETTNLVINERPPRAEL